jgi:hypothetical protein
VSTASPPPSAHEVAGWICRYLCEHPRAADTSLGIQRWWLAPIRGEVALASVEEALAELENEGVVEKHHPFADQPTYSRGPRFDRRG